MYHYFDTPPFEYLVHNTDLIEKETIFQENFFNQRTNLMDMFHFFVDLVVYYHNNHNKQVELDYLFLHIPNSHILYSDPYILKFTNKFFINFKSLFYLVMPSRTFYHRNQTHNYIYNLLNLPEHMQLHFDTNYFYKDQ